MRENVDNISFGKKKGMKEERNEGIGEERRVVKKRKVRKEEKREVRRTVMRKGGKEKGRRERER